VKQCDHLLVLTKPYLTTFSEVRTLLSVDSIRKSSLTSIVFHSLLILQMNRFILLSTWLLLQYRKSARRAFVRSVRVMEQSNSFLSISSFYADSFGLISQQRTLGCSLASLMFPRVVVTYFTAIVPNLRTIGLISRRVYVASTYA